MAKRALSDQAAPRPEEGRESAEPRYFEDEHGHRRIVDALATRLEPGQSADGGPEIERWPPYKTIWFVIVTSAALWLMLAGVVYALA